MPHAGPGQHQPQAGGQACQAGQGPGRHPRPGREHRGRGQRTQGTEHAQHPHPAEPVQHDRGTGRHGTLAALPQGHRPVHVAAHHGAGQQGVQPHGLEVPAQRRPARHLCPQPLHQCPPAQGGHDVGCQRQRQPRQKPQRLRLSQPLPQLRKIRQHHHAQQEAQTQQPAQQGLVGAAHASGASGGPAAGAVSASGSCSCA